MVYMTKNLEISSNLRELTSWYPAKKSWTDEQFEHKWATALYWLSDSSIVNCPAKAVVCLAYI